MVAVVEVSNTTMSSSPSSVVVVSSLSYQSLDVLVVVVLVVEFQYTGNLQKKSLIPSRSNELHGGMEYLVDSGGGACRRRRRRVWRCWIRRMTLASDSIQRNGYGDGR